METFIPAFALVEWWGVSREPCEQQQQQPTTKIEKQAKQRKKHYYKRRVTVAEPIAPCREINIKQLHKERTNIQTYHE